MSTASSSQGEIVVGLDIGTTKVCAVVGEVDAETASPSSASASCRAAVSARASSPTSTGRCARSRTPSRARRRWPASRSAPSTPASAGSHIRSPGLRRRRRHRRRRGHARRRRARARGRARHPGRRRPADPPRPAARVHRRQPGRHPRPDRDERRAPRREGEPRHRRHELRAERHPLRRALRPRRSPTSSSSRSRAPRPCSRDDEKEIGVAVVDIGGGTTDILLYVDGGIAHASVIPVGGNNITNDIAAGLRTPMAEADRLKRLSGCALGRMVADDEEIEVPGVGGHAPRKTARRVLSRHHRAARRGDLRRRPQAHRGHRPARAALAPASCSPAAPCSSRA